MQPSAPTGEASQPPDLIAVVCLPGAKPFDATNIDLNGAWAGDDGGIYYLRQLGSVVWWNGMSDRDFTPLALGRGWNNVGRGVITGLQIDVEWSDVPRGGGEDLGYGTLQLIIEDDGTGNTQIAKVGETGLGFGNELWTPCAPIELVVADYLLNYGGEALQYAEILTSDDCGYLASREQIVTTTLNTAEAGSPEFQTALGYSNAISERQHALDC